MRPKFGDVVEHAMIGGKVQIMWVGGDQHRGVVLHDDEDDVLEYSWKTGEIVTGIAGERNGHPWRIIEDPE